MAAYSALQLEREDTLIAKGPGFEVVERLLRLNEPDQKPYVEVFLLSRNSPDLSLRAFNSIDRYGLGIKAGSFTSGRSLGPFISAWELDLFLSNEITDVRAAIEAGAAAAKLGTAPDVRPEDPGDEVRIAFDGDAVVFSAESDEVFKLHGLQAFLKHERENAKTPMSGGPFGKFLRKLSILRQIFLNDRASAECGSPLSRRAMRLPMPAWCTPSAIGERQPMKRISLASAPRGRYWRRWARTSSLTTN